MQLCLSKDSRELLENGTGEGGRNATGAKLARDLIGTATELQTMSVRFVNDPRQLFDQYCARCSPPIERSEADSIWNSAEKSGPGASLSNDKIQTCIEAWQQRPNSGAKGSPKPQSNVVPMVRGEVAVDDFTKSEEYRSDFEHYQDEESRLAALAEARYSTKSEQYWLGHSKVYIACGGQTRSNIRNAWMAQAAMIGQMLAALSPRRIRILPCDDDVLPQVAMAWIIMEGAKGAGKSPLFFACMAIMNALFAIERSRNLEVEATKRLIKKLETDGNLPDDIIIEPHLWNSKPEIQIGNFSQASLRDALAAGEYWPSISKKMFEAGLSTQKLQSASFMLFNREAVSMFEDLGAFNQSETGVKAFLAGCWASELTKEVKRTSSVRLNPEDAGVGMLVAVQEGTLGNILAGEVRRKRGAVDTGFGSRFMPVHIHNTAKSTVKEFKQRDYNKAKAVVEDLQPLVLQLAALLNQIDQYVQCDQDATIYYRDTWVPWVNSRKPDWSTEWLAGYDAKLSQNVFRMAWLFRCNEMLDALAEGTTPQVIITLTAMARAIEYVQCAEAVVMYELAVLAKNQTLYEKAKDAEKQQSLIMSKFYVTLTSPDLAHQWVKTQRDAGVSTFRALTKKINGKTRATLKTNGVDVNIVLKPIWDGLEFAPTATENGVGGSVDGDDVDYSVTITYDAETAA